MSKARKQSTRRPEQSYGGAALGNQSTTVVIIADNVSVPPSSQPIDDASTFVCQHYHDFLNRQPDAGGPDF
jgi:hypothetical protein